MTVVGVLVAGKALGNVAASGGSEGRLASKAGDCRRGKRGLTTTTDTREKKQDTGGIHNMGVLC